MKVLQMNDELKIAGKNYQSRLLVGTGKYRDFAETRAAIDASGSVMASAMKKAIEAGRESFLAGRMPKKLYSASPSSPTTGMISGA